MAHAKFAGIEVPADITRTHFFFLYLNTLVIGILMVMPAVLQPAFLKDVIGVSQDYFGSINSFLSIISQIATLALAGLVGYYSDQLGRRIFALLGFAVLAVFFMLYFYSNQIAALLHVPAGLSAYICALISFVPHKAAEFLDFAPGLFTVYTIRLLLGVGFVLAFPQFVTMVADYTAEKDRGKGMAFNGLMIGVASITVFGLVAPVIKNYGVETAFYLASGLAFFGAVCTWLFLKDRMPEKSTDQKSLREIIGIVWKSPTLKASYCCSLITRADIVVASTFITTWGVMISGDYGLTSDQATARAAMPMVVLSLVSFLSFPVIGVLLDRWGRIQTIIMSLALGGTGMVLLAVCTNPYTGLVFVGVVLIAFGMPGAIAGANTLASDAAPKAMVGTILGGLTSMQPLGIIFFLVIGGFLFDALGTGWVFGLKGCATLLLGVWIFSIRKKLWAEFEQAHANAGVPAP
jgi:MFS family permease